MVEWDPHLATGALPRLRAPEDGLPISTRPPGRLGRLWLTLLGEGQADEAHSLRLNRGRTMARGGRVRAPSFVPGLASAEVHDTAEHLARIRVQGLDPTQRAAVRRVLSDDLRHLAALVEGELPQALLDALAGRDVHVVPRASDIEQDCDCGDYLQPCAHVAALHMLVADAIDGDPFVLLALRGLPRDLLLAELRAAWGDPEPEAAMLAEPDGPVPDGDWYRSPHGVPEPTFQPRPAVTPAAGLKALGPPPDGLDLVRPLQPLYEAGAARALAIALEDGGDLAFGSVAWKRRRIRGTTAPSGDGRTVSADRDVESAGDDTGQEQANMARTTGKPQARADETAGTATDPRFTEELIDALADMGSAKSAHLAEKMGVDLVVVRQELLDLEKLGIVYRTGQTRGTRWWLG